MMQLAEFSPDLSSVKARAVSEPIFALAKKLIADIPEGAARERALVALHDCRRHALEAVAISALR